MGQPGIRAGVSAPGFAPRPLPRAIRVVVVNHDDISRRGMASILAESPYVTVAGAFSHEEALALTSWDGVDVVIVGPVDVRRKGDQFPGVAVVERVRRHCTGREVTILVVTEHYFDDALRRRMREARADLFYHRAELGEASALYDLVLHPELARRGVPAELDPEVEFRNGVTSGTRVNRAVGYALQHGLEELLASRPQPRSRSWLRLRREFNREARLYPVTIDGRPPDRAQDLPSLPQIARFLNWATKAKTSHSAAAGPDRAIWRSGTPTAVGNPHARGLSIVR